MTTEELYEVYKRNPSVYTDSRKRTEGALFFALRGDRFDGHQFIQNALDAGAAYAVIDNKDFSIPGKTLLVNDVLAALQQLAGHHRKQFTPEKKGRPVPFIAITGSNGKTTTKELIHAVLSTSFKTYTTEGNLNNHIGIPLTILKIKEDAEMAIIEMGANHLGEIASYCPIAMPTHGLITNCGKAHLEGFGSEAGVRKGKGELFDYLRTHGGTAFLMNDYDYLVEMSRGLNQVFTYGTSDAHVVGSLLTNNECITCHITRGAEIPRLQTNLVGDYNLPNILAAVAVGTYFGIKEDKIKIAIENYTPSNSRSQLVKAGTNTFILDAYNANPSSMKSAIENFARIPGEPKILMLGAMAELGEESGAEHEALIKLIGQYTWKEVVLVGGDFQKIIHPYVQLKNAEEAKNWLKLQSFEHSYFLLKGSRSVQMEKILSE